jgi:dTDP-glucose 4,6-dehydratase
LGWEPEISLRDGVRDMVEWGRKYIHQLADVSPEYVLRA